MKRRLAGLLAATVVCAVAVASIASGATTSAPPCTARQLSGSFSAVFGSAGAGNVTYALRLRNLSEAPCFVSGIPQVRLVGKTGRLLPTRVRPSHPGSLTAVRVLVAPKGVTTASARFSPDVPGVGEPVAGRQCEPSAYRARVVPPPGGGTLVVPMTPPTPVCEKGTLLFSVFVAGSKAPVG